MLTFGLSAVALDDVIVIMSALEGGLHARQLVLHSVELHTGLFSMLADLAH